MVLAIGKALDLSPSDRDALLLAAGFAPTVEPAEISAAELAALEQAQSITLAQHEPYPAVVVDHCYNILRANNGAKRWKCWLYEVERPDDLPEIASNFIRGMFHPDGYGRHVANWDDCAYKLFRGLSSQVASTGARELLDELQDLNCIPEDWPLRVGSDRPTPLLIMNFEKDGFQINIFSISTTFGAPPERTPQTTRIQSVFPADDATRDFYRNLARRSKQV